MTQRLPYPQPGRPLVPPPLDEIMGDRLLDPWGVGHVGIDPNLHWRDLDERVWQLPRETVMRLADLVVRKLQGRFVQLASTHQAVIERPIPLAAIDLPPTIQNALRRRGFIRDQVVQPMRVRDVVLLTSIGPRALLVLLLELQALRRRPRRAMPPWAREVSVRDPRFGPQIRALEKADADEGRRLLATVEPARSASLPAELEGILAALVSPNHARALQRRFGWDGGPPGSLREAADLIGVTPERVRQVQRHLLARIERRGAVWTPALDRALAILKRCPRCGDAEIARRLRVDGISDRPFIREALVLAAEVFGKRKRRRVWRLQRRAPRLVAALPAG